MIYSSCRTWTAGPHRHGDRRHAVRCPPGGGAGRMHAYLGNGLELCEQTCARHDGVGGPCRAQVCSHNSKPFPRYACPRLAHPPGGSPDDMTSITVSVQTGGSCEAGAMNHEPAGRA